MHAGGGSEWVLDPGNPLRAPGRVRREVGAAAGRLRAAGVAGGAQGVEGSERELTAPGRGLGMDVAVRIWSPADAEAADPLPLLVANDGPEYAALAGLTDFCAAGIASGALPPHRVALVAPGRPRRVVLGLAALRGGARARRAAGRRRRGRRARRPGGDGRLARRARDAARPAPAPGRVRRPVPAVGELLRARARRPGARVLALGAGRRFVAEVLGGGRGTGAAPAVLTCGAAEENIHNNRVMAARLASSCTSCPTCTTTPPGETRCTRTSPACCRSCGDPAPAATPSSTPPRSARRATSSPTGTGGGRSSPSRPSAATPGSTPTAA